MQFNSFNRHLQYKRESFVYTVKVTFYEGELQLERGALYLKESNSGSNLTNEQSLKK